MAVWVVRAGPDGISEEMALSEGLVAITFHIKQPVTEFAGQLDLREVIETQFGEPRRRAGNFAGQLWRFAQEISYGDMIVLPRKRPKVIAVGRVSGDYKYRPELGVPHTRAVDWIAREIPRVDFQRALPKAISSQLTVFRISASEAESQIDQILAKVSEESIVRDDDPAILYKRYTTPQDTLEKQISNRIAARIRQQFSGGRLGYLVVSILRTSGYHATETRHGPDGYTDIVAGLGNMGFGHPRLCVRVKSSFPPVDLADYGRLQDSVEVYGADHGLLVSLGDFTEEVRAENERSFFRIRLWGLSDVVDMLLETYDDLPADIRSEIPLRNRGILMET